jgi:hypothetical protein
MYCPSGINTVADSALWCPPGYFCPTTNTVYWDLDRFPDEDANGNGIEDDIYSSDHGASLPYANPCPEGTYSDLIGQIDDSNC